MEALKRFGDFKVLEEITTMTSIFTDNEFGFTKRTKSTESDIFEISDRGRDEREHVYAGKLIINFWIVNFFFC